ncbi:MAG: xylulose kinase, partial [Spirochaetales bacterium]
GMLEWFKNNFAAEEQKLADAKGVSVWDPLMDLAKEVPAGSRGVFFLPHFAGAGAPHVDNRSLGAFAGLNEGADKGVLLRALIEGLDYQFLEFIVNLEKALGEKLERVVAVGGTARNSFWMQNKADVSGKAVEVPGYEEATPLGTAMLAGIGAGIYADEADAFKRVYKAGSVYEPDKANHELYRQYFEVYRKLYPGLKDISHTIFDMFRS